MSRLSDTAGRVRDARALAMATGRTSQNLAAYVEEAVRAMEVVVELTTDATLSAAVTRYRTSRSFADLDAALRAAPWPAQRAGDDSDQVRTALQQAHTDLGPLVRIHDEMVRPAVTRATAAATAATAASPPSAHAPAAQDMRRWLGLAPSAAAPGTAAPGPTDAELARLEPTPLSADVLRAALRRATLDRGDGHDSILPTREITRLLDQTPPDADIEPAVVGAVAAAGTTSFRAQMRAIEASSETLLDMLEWKFVLDPDTSSLDLLPTVAERDRYKTFHWATDDYPGGPVGANEDRANSMSAALGRVRPERRANRGADAILVEADFTAAMRRHIHDELRAVPDFPPELVMPRGVRQDPDHKLNIHAVASFVSMRAAAWSEGVPLIILASYRSPETAAHNAERSGNARAVARFSSHMFGVAMDLQMSVRAGVGGVTRTRSYEHEITTHPMQMVVDERLSPVHKWMYVRGEDFGWYPLLDEPWHWEYNPPGFHDLFRTVTPAAATGAAAAVGAGATVGAAAAPVAAPARAPGP